MYSRKQAFLEMGFVSSPHVCAVSFCCAGSSTMAIQSVTLAAPCNRVVTGLPPSVLLFKCYTAAYVELKMEEVPRVFY